MRIIEILAFWLVPSILILWIGGLALWLGNFYEFEYVLSKRKEFFRCLFQFPLFVWDASYDYVNNVGRIILTVIVSIATFEATCMIFVVLVCLLVLKFVCLAFLLVFRKRRNIDD